MEDKLNENVDAFWKKIQEQIQSMYINEKEVEINNENPDKEYTIYPDYDEPLVYENITFPSFQKKASNRVAINFYAELEYPDSNNEIVKEQIRIIENKNIEFINCYFLDIADFSEYTFSKSVTFTKCHFHKGILLNKTYENHLEFSECNFYSNDIDLSDRIFKSSLFFKSCENVGNLNLKNSIIAEYTSFRESKFKSAEFEQANFDNLVVFIGASFSKSLDFRYTVFNNRVFFQNVTIEDELNLETAIFKDEVNFLKIQTKVANRETARIIKHSFEKLDNIIEANRFYALEMQKREEELSTGKDKNWQDWIVFKFHQISSNHSQDWLLVLLWMLNITVLYTHFSFLMMDEKTEYYIIPFILNILTTVMIGFYFTKICKVLWTLVSCLIYVFISCDYLLCFIVNDFNPFSIMTGQESLTFGTLIYKAIIAYLIYQLIVSIRQNTRRQ